MNNMKSGGMMKQLMQMQKQLKQTQKELEKLTVTGIAGEGAVRIVLTGSQKFHSVKIDAEKIKGVSAEKLEKLVGHAVVRRLWKNHAN